MNIICSIAYSEPQCEQLKDTIDMLVKKQVSSSIRNVKNRGIIGVIRVIDHMVWERKDSQSEDLNCSYNTIESLPTKLSKVAANYIGNVNESISFVLKYVKGMMKRINFYPFTELAITSAQSCPQHLALFFDELATVFIVRNKERLDYQINKPFLAWLMTLISVYFESNFVVEEVPACSARWELQMIRALNTEDEMMQTESDAAITIAINIAGTLLNPSGR